MLAPGIWILMSSLPDFPLPSWTPLPGANCSSTLFRRKGFPNSFLSQFIVQTSKVYSCTHLHFLRRRPRRLCHELEILSAVCTSGLTRLNVYTA